MFGRFMFGRLWLRSVIWMCAVGCLAVHAGADDLIEKYREPAVKRWADDMKRIAALDAKEKHPDNAILFLGSSSIRLWNEMGEDLKPWPVINRGYGGAKFSDLAVLCQQIIKPHKFRAVVVFVGNDVTGGAEDKSPEEVVQLFEHVVGTIRKQAPGTPVFLIEITPTPRRWAAWEQIKEVNKALKAACDRDENLHFISTMQKYLGPDGGPMPELYRDDKLHQNRAGYARWSTIILPALEQVLKNP